MTEELKQIKYTAPAPVKKTRRSKKVVGGDIIKASSPPLPILSTTHAVGGVKKETIKVSLPYNESSKTPSPAKVVPAKVQVQPKSATLVKPAQAASVVLPANKPTVAPEPTIKVVNKPSLVRKTVNNTPKIVIQPTKRKNMTLKRKFTTKRITIQVENSKKLKKLRETAERNVDKLKPCDILNTLRKNGLVRPNANPPEALNRAMMLDIMMFPKPL
jgi:hypothetical protein